jgi:acylphosphatase
VKSRTEGLALIGFVGNLEDGSVTVRAVGEKPDLQVFLKKIQA